MSDSQANSPLKELLSSLVGVVLLVAIIGTIAVFAWLRPAAEKPVVTEAQATAQAAE